MLSSVAIFELERVKSQKTVGRNNTPKNIVHFKRPYGQFLKQDLTKHNSFIIIK